METYLLLRSNKQSGPYTLQQLVSFGLKPYDLVWVEGKSAAWRYPSEVEVLKSYAPSTEEQPYDRFYKKSEEKKIEEKPQEQVIVKPIEKQVEVIHQAPVENNIPASKKVFVSMPVNATAKKRVVTTTAPASEPKPVIAEQKPIPVQPKKIEAKPIYITEETNEPVIKVKKVIKDEPAELNEKYSESLDEIKKRYTETYLNRKKRSGWTSTHTSIAQVFGGAIFFCFLVVVVYKNFSGDETQLSRTTVIKPDKKLVNTTTPQNAKNKTSFDPASNRESNKLRERKQQLAKTEATLPDENSATVPAVQKQEETAAENDDAILASTTEEKNELPKPEEVKPKARPVNIHKMVNVRANNYRQMAFGGVKDLALTVNNDSKFALDKVVVELSYLKPSEQPIKTERIVFNSVGAGDSKTLRIPDYMRGVKISYRVLDIASSQYERQTAGL